MSTTCRFTSLIRTPHPPLGPRRHIRTAQSTPSLSVKALRVSNTLRVSVSVYLASCLFCQLGRFGLFSVPSCTDGCQGIQNMNNLEQSFNPADGSGHGSQPGWRPKHDVETRQAARIIRSNPLPFNLDPRLLDSPLDADKFLCS